MEAATAKVEEYIANAEPFARPILKHWRKLVLKNCPDAIESIKWGIPHFDYKKDFMCVMASYKGHCSFTFLKAELFNDPRFKDQAKLKPIQRFLGKITTLKDLPSDDEFIALLKKAMDLNERGIKLQRAPSEQREIEMPPAFAARLNAAPAAKEIFESKSPSFRKNYLAWISDAKTDATRDNRINQSMEWIAEGKDRFWQLKK